MSISIENWRGKELFVERYEQGRLLFYHVTNFFQERCRAEEEYQHRLEKLDKFNKTRLTTELWTLGNGWNAFEVFCSNEERLRLEFSTRLNDLLASTNELRKDLQNAKQNLTNEMVKWERGREKAQSEMVKSKQKNRSVTNELEQARLSMNKQGDSGEGKKKEANKLAQKVISLEKEQEAASKQAKQFELDYHNFMKKYQEGMKKILHNFAELDARRIISIRDLMVYFVGMNQEMYSKLLEFTENLKKTVSDIDERVDVTQWVKEALTPHLMYQGRLVGGDTELGLDLSLLEYPQSPTKEDMPLSPVSSLNKFGTIGWRKKKMAIMAGAPKSARGRSSDPFLVALNNITSERGDTTNMGTIPDSSGTPSEEEEAVEQETKIEKEKKKSPLMALFDQVSPRYDKKEKEKL